MGNAASSTVSESAGLLRMADMRRGTDYISDFLECTASRCAQQFCILERVSDRWLADQLDEKKGKLKMVDT